MTHVAKSQSSVDDIVAQIDGVMALAHAEVTDPIARALTRQVAAGVLGADEAVELTRERYLKRLANSR